MPWSGRRDAMEHNSGKAAGRVLRNKLKMRGTRYSGASMPKSTDFIAAAEASRIGSPAVGEAAGLSWSRSARDQRIDRNGDFRCYANGWHQYVFDEKSEKCPRTQTSLVALACFGGLNDPPCYEVPHRIGAREARQQTARLVERRTHGVRCLVVEANAFGRYGFQGSLPNLGRERSWVTQSPKPEGVSVMGQCRAANQC